MPQTLSKARTSRGATYVEISAVIFILALFAAVVSPSFTRASVSQQATKFYAEALSVCKDARERAISQGQPVQVSVNDQESAVTASLIGDAQEDGSTLATAQMPDAIRTVDASGWSVVFNPDGTADPDSVEFGEGDITRFLVVERDGSVKWQNEPPDEETRWEAGTIESRT